MQVLNKPLRGESAYGSLHQLQSDRLSGFAIGWIPSVTLKLIHGRKTRLPSKRREATPLGVVVWCLWSETETSPGNRSLRGNRPLSARNGFMPSVAG